MSVILKQTICHISSCKQELNPDKKLLMLEQTESVIQMSPILFIYLFIYLVLLEKAFIH